jgi:dolichol-phosphate mannosyltransferase
MTDKIHISVVVPLYRCEKYIVELYERVKKSLSNNSLKAQFIFVNDGSPGNDWLVVEELAKQKVDVLAINLSRNFGQHQAITAGLTFASGEWVVVMDGDLQDSPEEIINLYNKAQNNFDIVYAQRKQRKDTRIKKMSSRLYYAVFSYLTDSKQDKSIANFGIYRHKVIKAILSMKDNDRYFPTMSQWVGYRSTTLEVQHFERDGETGYSWSALIKLAFNNIIAYSDKPLRLTVRLGLIISVLSFFIGVYYMIQSFRGIILVEGFVSLIISIWFLSGIIIMILGVIGIYVGKVYDKVKDRPTFIVSETVNLEQHKN